MSSMDDETIKMYRVRKTVMQMLNDRGYAVNDDEINMTEEQFLELYGVDRKRDNLFISKEMRNNSSIKIHVYFVASNSASDSISVGQIRDYLRTMMSQSVSRVIFVVRSKLSSYAQKGFAEYPRLTAEVFLEAELVVNVMNHALVPEHRVLTEDEKKELLDKYRVKETQLPKILKTDPVARHFGLQRGNVVKIIRPSDTAGKYVTYRILL